MDAGHFDALARAMNGSSRRRFLASLGGGVFGSLVPHVNQAETDAGNRNKQGKKKKRKSKKCSSRTHLCKDLDGEEFCCSNDTFCCPGPGGDPGDGLGGTCCYEGGKCCPDGSCLSPTMPCS